jgi:hypothetical protein
MNGKIAALGGLAAALGVGAFLNFRLTIRREVLRQLRDVYGFDAMIATNPLFSLGAKYLNVPSSAELAESVVPLGSFIMPEKALEDILANGRKSAYWPANRRTTKAPKVVDDAIFVVLRKLYYAQKQQQIEG